MGDNYRFVMEKDDIVRTLITTVGSFIQDRLMDKERRIHHKEQCAERLAAGDHESPDKDAEIRYSDQAILANLDWGIEALEKAISTSSVETKIAQLDYAEKMLQLCAMLNSSQKTAGVPNSYLSAWAHLNLSYLWKLRNNIHNAVIHILDMFIVDPIFSRIDFAPGLWKSMFLPHMGSIIGWYSDERQRIVMEVLPDTSDLSFTIDFDQYFNESLILSIRPDQAERMQELGKHYGQLLDENTMLYAKYYMKCVNYDSASSGKEIPMLPIAEPPMTPLHEFSSHLVPDYVKFGPILPIRAGYSPVLKSKEKTRDTSKNLEESRPEKDGDSDEDLHEYMEGRTRSHEFVSNSFWVEKDDVSNKVKNMSPRQSPQNSSSSPMDSPKSPSATTSSPKTATKSGKIQTCMLRLLSTHAMDSSISGSQPVSPHSSISSMESEGEMTVQLKTTRRSVDRVTSARQVFPKSSFLNQGDEGNLSHVSSPTSEVLTPQSRPPKDFICPITGQIFNDPVTLETGQTYERKAIQEWMNRGNTTCPITRQPLSATSLPKTNYILKRLITSWKDQHPDLAQEFSCTETPRNCSRKNNQRTVSNKVDYKPQRFTRTALSTSPTSVISQASIETVINAMKPFMLCLCNSENLQECEEAILTISKIWEDSKVDSGIHAYLSSPTIINAFSEILSASSNKDVLQTTIYILSKLISADDSVGDLLTRVDSDFYCLVNLLKKGLEEAVVLMYLLGPSFSHLSSHNLATALLNIISNENEDCSGFQYAIAPKDAAIVLLERVVVCGDDTDRSHNAMNVITENGIPALLNCLDRVDGQKSIVSILLCCMRTDKTCKSMIANRIELLPVLELFHGGNDSVRGMCIEFLCELIQLSRRTMSNQILLIIREEGTFSTMHTLLVYLQMSPMEQKPAIATLLLQLDLLDPPRKMSIYREEAIEVLIEALESKDFPSCQIKALEAILSQRKHMESWLLKIAGFEQHYNTDETEFPEMKEEEKAARTWEKRMAFVFCNHEKGIIFKALEECLESNSIEIAKSCLVATSWLVNMLYSFPDSGVRDVACKSLLNKFVHVLKSSKSIEEKILAALVLRRFITEPGGLNAVGKYARSMWKTLRRLKKTCTIVHDIMKALMNLPSIDAAELWSCVEGPEIDVSMNGEILSMIHARNRLITSHSDGTIKVWDTGKRPPRLIQEAREHSKAVTCLHVPPSCDKLYSGSLDKTIRVWSIKHEEIQCIQVHDVKEAVLVLAANCSVACFSSQSNGIKIYSWSGIPKNINFNKQVKCVAVDGDRLYCGCSGYSIQEVDLRTQTSTTFYSGAKKLLGKQTIYSVQIHNGLLYASGSSVDGISGKVFKLSSKAVIGCLQTGLDIQQTTVNNDFIFTTTKCGIIEVWLKEKVSKIACIKLGSVGNARITSIASDVDGQKLFAGTSNGRLQVWSLD